MIHPLSSEVLQTLEADHPFVALIFYEVVAVGTNQFPRFVITENDELGLG